MKLLGSRASGRRARGSGSSCPCITRRDRRKPETHPGNDHLKVFGLFFRERLLARISALQNILQRRHVESASPARVSRRPLRRPASVGRRGQRPCGSDGEYQQPTIGPESEPDCEFLHVTSMMPSAFSFLFLATSLHQASALARPIPAEVVLNHEQELGVVNILGEPVHHSWRGCSRRQILFNFCSRHSLFSSRGLRCPARPEVACGSHSCVRLSKKRSTSQ